eukprot:gene16291-18457_t
MMFFLFFLTLVSKTLCQTLQALPTTNSWHGFTSDSSSTYLTAAQSPFGGDEGQIYFSLNGGLNWSLSNAPAQGYYGIAGSSSGQILLTVGHSSTPYVSLDYGSTWTKRSTIQGISNSVAISGNGQCMAYTLSSGISFSNNQGASWSTIGPNVECQAVSMDTTGTHIVVAVNAVGLYYSENSGETFTLQYSNSSANYDSIAFSGIGSVYAGMTTSPYSLLVSSNYGLSWSVASNNTNTFYCLSVSSNGQNIISLIGGQLYFSTNAGVSFTELTSYGCGSECAINGDGDFVLYNYGGSCSTDNYVYSANPYMVMPTLKPSFLPSLMPSFKPSLMPSFKPSFLPSLMPSFKPSLMPSFKPSFLPSLMPSFKPSLTPSFKPSHSPTISKSSKPTTDAVSSDCSSNCPTSCPAGYGGTYWALQGCIVYCTDQPTNGQCAPGGSGCTSSCQLLTEVIAAIVVGGVAVLSLTVFMILWKYGYCCKKSEPLSSQVEN